MYPTTVSCFLLSVACILSHFFTKRWQISRNIIVNSLMENKFCLHQTNLYKKGNGLLSSLVWYCSTVAYYLLGCCLNVVYCVTKHIFVYYLCALSVLSQTKEGLPTKTNLKPQLLPMSCFDEKSLYLPHLINIQSV